MSVAPAKLGAGLAKRRTFAAAAGHSVGLGISCLITYLLVVHVLAPIHSISKASDALGGMWAVISTLFVYRESHRESVSAALTRVSATLLSLVLCLIYLLIFPFHPLGLAVLIGLGTFLLMAARHDELVITAAITTAVVMVVAAVSPHDAWQQPILRGVDTAVGIAVGVVASSIAVRLGHVRASVPDAGQVDPR
jgi:Fusaric acid resistance protein-like